MKLLATALILFVVGCNRGPAPVQPVRVTGVVKIDGQPLREGEILFKVPGEVPVIAPISAGAYDIALTPGSRVVEVMAYRQAKDFDMAGVIIKGSKENYLSAKYNVNSTLTAEVTAEGPNQFSFDLSTK